MHATTDDHPLRNATAKEVREAIRRGRHTGPTAGLALGYAQANLVILPANAAEAFGGFCQKNPRPCPLISTLSAGDPEAKEAAPGSDVRTDVPRYRVFRDGKAEEREPSDISALWRDDLVGFLLGCSFTFEAALLSAGLGVRHLEEGRNVPMYRTSIVCQPVGPFAGPMTVSMRPYSVDQVDLVIEVTSRFPEMHGPPVHVGDPGAIGIDDLARPDFGEPVSVRPGEVPLFWACGVTPQLAVEGAGLDIAITHSPGRMFVTDLRDTAFCVA